MQNIAMRAGLILLVFSLGCSENNPFFCNDPANASDPTCKLVGDGSIDAPPPCTSNAQCTSDPMAGVCDTGTGKCVQCTTNMAAACTGTTPACVADACAPCKLDSQCPDSNVCNLDGSCEDPSHVLYASPAGTGSCTQTAPCSLATALQMIAPPITTIALGSGSYDQSNIPITKTITLHGAGASTTQLKNTSAGGGVITITHANLTVTNVEIGPSPGNGITCDDSAGALPLVVADVTVDGNTSAAISTLSCDVTIERAQIHDNGKSPGGGGILISKGSFLIQNNFLVKNGDPAGSFGALDILNNPTPGTFRFNTVTENSTPNNMLPPGVSVGGGSGPYAFANNIVFNNVGGPATGPVTSDANTTWTFSDIDATVSGTGNINADPKFLSATDVHIGSDSPARSAGSADPDVTDDIDREPRPQGAGYDMGADEIP